MGDTVKDKELLKEKSSFKLSSFIKNKILGMYGIKKDPATDSLQQKNNIQENPISSLLPKDNTKT